MSESVAVRGYAQTSVKHIIGLAGVSRRAFYEQFENKQSCFLAAFDQIAERLMARIGTTCESIDGGLAEHLLGGLGMLASEVLEQPKDAQLMFVEIDLLGADGAKLTAKMMAGFERMLSERIGASAPPPLLKGAIGAVHQIIRLLLLEQRSNELPSLGERLLSWLLLLDEPSAAELHTRLRAAAPERVRAVKQTHDVPIAEPRERLLSSVLTVAREVGYKELSAIQIAEVAGLSLDTFFEYFEEHEQCFVAALQLTADRSLTVIPEPDRQSSNWPAQLCRSLRALLSDLAKDELRAWALVGAAREMGAPGVERDRLLARSVAMKICAAIPPDAMDEIVIEQTAGALWHTVRSLQAAGRSQLLAALDGYIAYLILAPIIGGQEALRAIEESDSDS